MTRPSAATAFLIVFTSYQLPEGVGARVLHSFPAQAGLMLLSLGVAFVVGRALGFRGFDAYALAWRAAAGASLARTFVLGVIAKIAALAIGGLAGAYAVAPLAATGVAGLATALLLAAVTTFVPSLAEDIVTRGIPYRLFGGAAWKPAVFVAASALLYVANHVFRLAEGPVEWARLFAFGLAYAAALARSGSLWAAVGLHWGWNFANAAADSIVTVTLRQPSVSPWISVAAHLGLLALVPVVLPKRAAITEEA